MWAQINADAPRNLSVQAVDGGVLLTWDAPINDAAAVTGYTVLRRRPGIDAVGAFEVLVANTGSPATSYTDTTTGPGQSYTYRVQARRGSVQSHWSNYARVDLPTATTTPTPTSTVTLTPTAAVSTPTTTATSTPTPTATTATPTPTSTVTPTPTATASTATTTATTTPTLTLTVTSTTPTPTSTVTPTPTATASTATTTATTTPTLTLTVTSTTPTPTSTVTPTPTATTATPTPTSTVTPTPTATASTATTTATTTPTLTLTVTSTTPTPTSTVTPTPTATASTATTTATTTPTLTLTVTSTTPTPTSTVTPTPTATTTATQTATTTPTLTTTASGTPTSTATTTLTATDTPTATPTTAAGTAQTTGAGPGYEQIPALGRKLRPTQYQNLDYALNEVVRKIQPGSVPRGRDGRQPRARASISQSVAVVIAVEAGHVADVLTFLLNNGALAEHSGAGETTVFASVPVTLLPRLSQQPGVIFVRTEHPGEPAGGPGATAHGANHWSDVGFEGQGVKIGIVDFGFADYWSFRIGTVLPGPAAIICYGSFGSSVHYRTLEECRVASGDEDHGTAVTEMAYDVAPQATYYLVRVQRPSYQFRLAVDWLIEQDVDVISASWSVDWDGPGDGTSSSASSPLRAVDKAVQNGIVVTISAGNYGGTSWFGTFNDPDDDNVLDFVDSDECNFMHGTFSGSGALVEVRWEDDWSGPGTDLDIYVRKVSDGTIMAQSEDSQTGQSYQEPTESISYTAPAGTGALCLSIEHQSGDAPDWVQMIDIRSLGMERRTFSHGLRNPAETVNAGALTVGQAAHDDTSTIHYDSSRGPLPNDTIKPDIVGASEVHSSVYGYSPSGTSFAAPHIAGLAALVKQRYPTYTPSQIAQYLKDHAAARDGPDEDEEPDAPNNYWGYGFAQLPPDFLLSGLTVSPVDITDFDSTVSIYHVSVTDSVTQVSVTPTAHDPDATIEVGTTTVASGTAHTVSTAEGRTVITITVTASDDTATMTYRVIVDRGFNSPWFPATATTRAVAENTATVTDVGAAVTATDADDGDTLTYSLGGTEAASFTIDSASGQLRTKADVTYDHETRASYAVTVSVHDGKGSDGTPDSTIDDSIAVTITVSNVDEPGTVSLSAEQPQVGVELTAMLDDPDGSVTGVTWKWERSPFEHAWYTIRGATTDRYTPVAWFGAYRLRVTASYDDGHGADKSARQTAAHAVQAAVNSAPQFPSSETGARSVPENTSGGVTIGGPVAATDPENDTLAYTLGGTDANSFTIVSTSGQLQTKAGQTYDHEVKASYSVTVSVHDGKDADGNASTAIDDTITVTITVTDVNEPPAFPASETGARSVPENTTGGVNIGAPVAAMEDDGDTLTYAISGSEAASFDVHASSGQLRTKAGVTYNHEAKGSYSFTLAVHDGKNRVGGASTAIDDSITVTVTVTNVDEPPVVSGSTSVSNYTENGTGEVARYSAADPENDAITWSLAGADGGRFAISTGGVLTFKAPPPDYEAPTDTGRNNEYQVTVVATAGGKTGTRAVTVTVTDENELPVVSGPTSVTYQEHDTREVARYSVADPEQETITWSLGPSHSNLSIATDGADAVVTFDSPPDYEALESAGNTMQQVIVMASDGPNAVVRDLIITVENIEEPGTVNLSSQQPQVGTQLTATLADPDDSITGRSWTWERSPTRSSWSTISGAATARYTPVDGDLNHYLRVTAAYSDGHGAGKSAQQTSDYAVQAAPRVNHPPEFPSGTSTEREIAESSPPNTPVGARVAASDQDNDRLTYTLTAGAVDSFTIDDPTGQLRIGPDTQLDHETQRSYSVRVTATDPSTESTSIFITITVTDVNEPPTAAPDMATTAEDTPTVLTVLRNDEDPEKQSLSVSSLTQPGDGTATVETGDQEIRYMPRADFHGSDTFTYTVSDGVHTSAPATVRVTVTAVNDPPAFPSATAERSVAPHAAAGTSVGAPVAASDPEGDSLTYTLTGADARFFAIDEYTGQITVRTGTVLDPASQASYAVTVTARDPSSATDTIEVTITVASAPPPPPSPPPSPPPPPSPGNGGGGPPAARPAPPRSPLIGRTHAATAMELAGDLLVLQRHDQPGVEIEVGIGWISQDGQHIIAIGFVRDGDLGQTYAVVRREGDGRVVRRWIAPDSPLVYVVPWAVVNTQYTFPVGVILAIPLDDQYPWPNMLTRRFDGGDDRILAYDAERGQWRHVPDLATFQARGYYWCNVTAADAGFFDRITLGTPLPASSVPARGDYPNCLTA